MMQRVKLVAIACVIGILGYYYYTSSEFLAQMLDSGEFLTLEARYSARDIMETHQDRLLKGPNYKFLKPNLKYYPYLLMEVKYSRSDKRTAEGMLLWSLVDGEMVLDTQSWATTHGFADCIKAGADPQDFELMYGIIKRRGSATKETLKKELGASDSAVVERWLNTAIDKHLIVEYGNEYRLHFAHPVMDVVPETTIAERFVSKPYKHSDRVYPRFSKRQIEGVARIAFGSRFAIRDSRTVYVPAYSIEVKNPDGSTMTSHWSALNGEMINHEYLQ